MKEREIGMAGQTNSPDGEIALFKLGSRYYYARLSPNDRVLYRKIYDQWLTGASVAELNIPGTGFETPDGTPFRELVLAVVEDNPHLFHVERTHFNYARKGSHVLIMSQNYYTPAQFKDMYRRLKQKVDQILTAARKYKTKLEQVRFLHDYLAASITYDWCEGDLQKSREAHTMVGALINRRCVCDGYARAFRLLCDRLGISCIVVIGEGPTDGASECHAWNMVKLDGVPYHVDVTWDSNCTEGRLVKDFEFMTSDEVAARRHAWERDKYPRCPRQLPRREPLVTTPGMLQAQLEQHLKAGHKNFMLRLGGPLATKSQLDLQLRKMSSLLRALVGKGKDLWYYCYTSYHYAEFALIDKR